MRTRALSTQLVNRIARLLFNGMDDEETAILVDLPVFRVKALRSGKEDSRVKKASLLLKNAAIERIIKGRGKLSGLQWFMERRYPKQYAKAEVQLTMSTGSTTHNTLIVSADVAEGLLKRAKPVSEELERLIRDKNPDNAADAP